MTQTYLITGASGFIGSSLARRLINQHKNVHLILQKQSNTWRINSVLNKATVHISDLSNVSDLTKIIQKVKPTIIYHLATNGAYSSQNNPDKIITTNILGTWNLLTACNTVDYDLFVNTGSSSEYGFKTKAMRETDIVEPASYYAVTKCAQTLLCNYLAKQEKRPIVTLRLFSVYGPYEESSRLIPTLMKSLLFGLRMNLVTPDVARDQIYIDDVTDVYLNIEKLMRHTGEYFNIGTGIQSTVKDVVDTTVKVTGKTTVLNWGNMKNRHWDTTNWVADISKATSLLKWTPKTSLEEGLTETWNWFRKNFHYYS